MHLWWPRAVDRMDRTHDAELDELAAWASRPPYIHPWEYVWATGRIWERIFRPTIHPVKERVSSKRFCATRPYRCVAPGGAVEQHVGKPRDPSSTESV
jgi:hypothetical protein